MKPKRISVRFNLDCDDDRKAWEILHRLDAKSINREIIMRINATEQANVLKELVRQVVAEELTKIPQGSSFQPPPQQEDCAEEIEGVFDFLNSF